MIAFSEVLWNSSNVEKSGYNVLTYGCWSTWTQWTPSQYKCQAVELLCFAQASIWPGDPTPNGHS